VFDRYLRSFLFLLGGGVCNWCAGRLRREVLSTDFPADRDWTVTFECEHCRAFVRSDVASAVLFHPAVVAFYHDHGVDVLRAPTWEVDPVDDATVEVHGEDPWRATLALERDGDALALDLDDEATVRAVRREPSGC
jgi:hypothetical protein